MANRIHILEASGSGTTTLGQTLEAVVKLPGALKYLKIEVYGITYLPAQSVQVDVVIATARIYVVLTTETGAMSQTSEPHILLKRLG